MVSFIIPGECVPQARPRFQATRYGVHTYEPEKCRKYKERVKACAMAAMRDRVPMGGAIGVLIRTYRHYPKRMTKEQRKHPEDMPPVTRPDVDNLAKAVLDGMNGICYMDDAQITTLTVSKEYGEEPYVRVEIWED